MLVYGRIGTSVSRSCDTLIHRSAPPGKQDKVTQRIRNGRFIDTGHPGQALPPRRRRLQIVVLQRNERLSYVRAKIFREFPPRYLLRVMGMAAHHTINRVR